MPLEDKELGYHFKAIEKFSDVEAALYRRESRISLEVFLQ